MCPRLASPWLFPAWGSLRKIGVLSRREKLRILNYVRPPILPIPFAWIDHSSVRQTDAGLVCQGTRCLNCVASLDRPIANGRSSSRRSAEPHLSRSRAVRIVDHPWCQLVTRLSEQYLAVDGRRCDFAPGWAGAAAPERVGGALVWSRWGREVGCVCGEWGRAVFEALDNAETVSASSQLAGVAPLRLRRVSRASCGRETTLSFPCPHPLPFITVHRSEDITNSEYAASFYQRVDAR